MRRVHKGAWPRAATELHARRARWGEEQAGQKAELREAALAEQRGLCAYCNRPIDSSTRTRLEHWSPRSDPATQHFFWPDLLAVCDGGESGGGRERWCDAARGNRPLTLHPARGNPPPEASVRYLADGRAKGSTEALDREIREVLNLNATLLVRAREQAVDAVLSQISRAKQRERVADTLEALEALASRYDEAHPTLPPFPCAARPLIEQALKQARGKAKALRP